MAATLSSFTMADMQQPATNMDYLQAPLDFENGFGFSPATSPSRDPGMKQEYGGYFTNSVNDSLPLFDQSDADLFNTYPQPTSMQSLPQNNNFPAVNSKLVHGQVTPPSDNSPTPLKCEVNTEPNPVSLDDSAPSSKSKKRGSQASQTQTQIQSTNKRRKTAGSRKSSSDSSVGDGKEEKRSKFLERNRVAASKCRQKKKEWTSNLEQKARDLSHNKTQLSILVNSLRDEVLYLKSEVLKHDSCNCTALRNYMSRSVSQISGEAGASSKLPVPTSTSPASDLDLDGMSFAGSPQMSNAGTSPSTTSSSPA